MFTLRGTQHSAGTIVVAQDGATLGSGDAVDVARVAWGATENAVCDGVGRLSDPLERQLIWPTLPYPYPQDGAGWDAQLA